MGYEYALVHLKFTIPPAVILTILYGPLCSRLDAYKIAFLVTIAVVATTPWDSYLIRRAIWTYPSSVILGPRLWGIPAEEYFFFVVQTYITSLLYLLLGKSSVKATGLRAHSKDRRQEAQSKTNPNSQTLAKTHILKQAVIAAGILYSVYLVYHGGSGTYMGLIGVWAGPFFFLLHGLAHQLWENLPWKDTAIPILLPTIYLWLVDTLALRRGTWSIGSATILGIYVWPALEIEEAVFFLATNALVVFGMLAFDKALAVLQLFPHLFPEAPALPTPLLLIRALLVGTDEYDADRISGLQEAVKRLRSKSRSFYLASSVFEGRLRLDLIRLYSFCRAADDLVDTADSKKSARHWIACLEEFLNLAYAETACRSATLRAYITTTFPPDTHSALALLPTTRLPSQALYDLVAGFRTDLAFSDGFPIDSEDDLALYSSRVAGTIAELCLALVYHHDAASRVSGQASEARQRATTSTSGARRSAMILASRRMGIALQYVNIVRDVATDAQLGRVYLPTQWLLAEGSSPTQVVQCPRGDVVRRLRIRLLAKAFAAHDEAVSAMASLPCTARVPLRVAVESYMEIGRVLQEELANDAGQDMPKQRRRRATVPLWRRLAVAWRVLRRSD